MLKYDWTKWRQEVWTLEEELDKDVDSIQLNTVNTLPAKLLKDFETSIYENK